MKRTVKTKRRSNKPGRGTSNTNVLGQANGKNGVKDANTARKGKEENGREKEKSKWSKIRGGGHHVETGRTLTPTGSFIKEVRSKENLTTTKRWGNRDPQRGETVGATRRKRTPGVVYGGKGERRKKDRGKKVEKEISGVKVERGRKIQETWN